MLTVVTSAHKALEEAKAAFAAAEARVAASLPHAPEFAGLVEDKIRARIALEGQQKLFNWTCAIVTAHFERKT